MKILSMNHAGITVKNLEESMKFYQGVMGFKVINPPCDMVTDEEEGLAILGLKGVTHRICLLEIAEGHYLELMEFGLPKSEIDKPLPMNTIGTHHVSYKVDDINEWVDKLTEMGLKFNYKVLPYETDKGTDYWVLFKDPNGVTIELYQQA